MEIWPSTIDHRPDAGSFQGEPFRAPDTTEFEDGPFRQRRRSTLQIAKISFWITMSNSEFAQFRTWVCDTLVDGTLQFEMPILFGSAYVTKVCQFRTPYKFMGAGAATRVQFDLDVEDY